VTPTLQLEHPGDQARDAPAAGRIDLHGLSVAEAIEKVMAEIDRSLQRGADRLEVVHGKGSGLIRDALHKRLAALSVVAKFRLDPRNAGVTWVYF
jgi:DNA mismatch repair protein MutS2